MKKKIIALILCAVLFCAIGSTAFAEKVIVTFDAKDGTPVPSPTSIPSNTTVARPSPNPQKADFIFDDWYLGNTPWKFSSEDGAIPVTENLTLVAHWKKAAYTITVYTPANGTLATNKTTAAENDNVTFTVKANDGYYIESVNIDGSKDVPENCTSQTYTIQMPAYDIAASANFKKGPDPVTVSLNKQTVELAKTDTTGIVLTATTSDGSDVTWTSTSEAVTKTANKNNLTVKPVAIGTATITATTTDGHTASCVVNVVEKVVVENISFTLPTSKITDKTPFTITATVTPANCTEPVEWSVSPSDILSITKDPANSKNATITPLKNGSCKITAKCGGKSCECTIDVAFTSDYAVVYNKNGSWYYDAPTDYTIQTRRPYSSDGISSITITNKYNGIEYKAIEGSDFIATKAKNSNDTVISFYKAFMKELPHYKNQLITVTYKDGTTSKTGLHILSVKDRPITGDTDYTPYIILAAVSAAGLGAVLTLKKKQKV